MKIFSMTATFGKLDHATLTLEPGLNVIQAPNEWGKSTWCAFLVAMLYGLDTRERTKKGALAEKERYAPWSGAPMSGEICLQWQGRNITIQRRSKGRIPLGDFLAYESDTGLPVPELTAANCGQMLLGVERSVYTQSGFIRSTDMPVTQNEDLARRLNALVTTGDEGAAGEDLGRKLRDLKNKVRYNRTGALPEAQAQADRLREDLRRLEELNSQARTLRQERDQLLQRRQALEDHLLALDYADAQADAARVAQGVQALAQAQAEWDTAQWACAGLPDRAAAQAALDRQVRRQLPQPPQAPPPFQGLTPEEAAAQAQADAQALEKTTHPGPPWPWLAAGGILAALGICSLSFLPGPGWALIGLGLVLGSIGAVKALVRRRRKHRRQALQTDLARRYGTPDPEAWLALARQYAAQWAHYRQALQAGEADRTDYAAILRAWDRLDQAEKDLAHRQSHLQALKEMARTAPPPPGPDELTLSRRETDTLLSRTKDQLDRLHQRLGQCQGQMESLGSRETLSRDLAALEERIRELDTTYAALDYALTALDRAQESLRRRFAPTLCRQAQQIFSQLTGGRYTQLTLGPDLSVQAQAQGEDGLRSHLWRSEGTVDQLYLAVRLAVARVLIPQAPLVLDDALVRSDDQRYRAALDLLREEARTRQVIVFSCRRRDLP